MPFLYSIGAVTLAALIALPFAMSAHSFAGVCALLAACGFSTMAAIPVAMELAAEATFPISEGVSGGYMNLMGNALAVVCTVAMDRLQAGTNFVTASTIFFCSPAFLCRLRLDCCDVVFPCRLVCGYPTHSALSSAIPAPRARGRTEVTQCAARHCGRVTTRARCWRCFADVIDCLCFENLVDLIVFYWMQCQSRGPFASSSFAVSSVKQSAFSIAANKMQNLCEFASRTSF